MTAQTTKPKCCYCGDTERLHTYGQIDSGFSKDLESEPRKIYACQSCDPIFTEPFVMPA